MSLDVWIVSFEALVSTAYLVVGNNMARPSLSSSTVVYKTDTIVFFY